MKKFMIVFPALLLVCAGISMTGCTSDPEPPQQIEKPDMVFSGGKYQYQFDTPRIEDGKEYEVILTIEDCDADFIGSHMGGKICYKTDMDDDTPGSEKILSGWLNSVPDTVSATVKKYKWTFKAGDRHSDDQGVTIESPATAPAGATQYFSLTAQDSSWNNYDSSYNFGIKGSFEIKFKETISDWISEGTVTLGDIDGDGSGKGEFSDDDMAKIRSMPAGSKIVLTVSVIVNDSDAQPGYGVGKVGTWDDGISIDIPSNASAGPLTFTVDIDIADLLEIIVDGNIIINVYNGAAVTKAELFKPGT